MGVKKNIFMNYKINPQFQIKVANQEEMEVLGSKVSKNATQSSFISLFGDLGVGKTVFARGFIQALTSKEQEVISPTFNLIQTYETHAFDIFHYDLYRIENASELLELGFEEAISLGVVLVEWPCKLGELLPSERLDIKIIQDSETNVRIVEFFGFGSWLNLLPIIFDYDHL